MAKHYFADFHYQNLELPAVREFAKQGPKGFLANAGEPLGSLFENLAIVEAMKAMTHRGKKPNLTLYRDNHRQEIDLLL